MISTLSVNTGCYLERHLRQVIEEIETRSPVELLAIGIGHDVTRYYRRAVTITDPSELAGAMTDKLVEMFEEGAPAAARQRLRLPYAANSSCNSAAAGERRYRPAHEEPNPGHDGCEQVFPPRSPHDAGRPAGQCGCRGRRGAGARTRPCGGQGPATSRESREHRDRRPADCAFERSRPEVTRFGPLEFRGGLVLGSPSVNFGGWSALVMEPAGKSPCLPSPTSAAGSAPTSLTMAAGRAGPRVRGSARCSTRAGGRSAARSSRTRRPPC